MKGMKKCVAVVSAVAMVITGLNQIVITDSNKVRANNKPVEAVLLDDSDRGETFHKATVNIFDYNSANTWEDYSVYGLKEKYGNQSSYWLKNCGVNLDIRKKFAKSSTDKNMDNELFLFGGERHKYKNQAEYNEWTGEQGGIYQGLIKNKLNTDGSLEFSNGINCINLFPSSDAEKSVHITSYYNSEFLFQQRDGYYVFDSDNDKICSSVSGGALQLKFDFEKKGPIFNTSTGTHNRNYGFFPLNSNDEDVEEYTEKRHHMFGMELTVDFNVNSSRTINGKDMEFTFSGDDDVWVFIDGNLVLDLGGIHNKATGSINFKTGEIKYGNDSQPIKTYEEAESVVSGGAVSGTAVSSAVSLADYTPKKVLEELEVGKHTLKLFYLERGESDSNCMIQFNLPVEETVIPTTPSVTTPTDVPTKTPVVTAPVVTDIPVKTPVVTETPSVSYNTPIVVTPTPKETEKVRVTPDPEKTKVPDKTEGPKETLPIATEPVLETETPKTTVSPVPTEVVVSEEPVPEETVKPSATPLITEETMVPNVPKPTEDLQQTENPVVITEEPVPGGVVPIPTATVNTDTTTKPDTNVTERPYVTPSATDIEIIEETGNPAGPVEDDNDEDQRKKEKKKSTIIIDDQTPGNLPKTGGIADLMENGKAASYTVIAFLLGSAVIFSVGKVKVKKVKK